MNLNTSKGDMYDFVTHTGNIIKGRCPHDCKYCYMKKMGRELNPLWLDVNELKIPTPTGNFIFVGSSTDMFADAVLSHEIMQVLNHCYESNNNLFGDKNQYLFQSKNPQRFLEFIEHPVFMDSVVCTTIESNRFYAEYLRYSPQIEDRVAAMEQIAALGVETYVTIEPIMCFDLDELVEYVMRCQPKQVNVGVNTYRDIRLPEPSLAEVTALIERLSQFTTVKLKSNLVTWMENQK